MLPNRNEGHGNIGRHGAKGLRKPRKHKPHKSKPHKPNRLDDPGYVTRPRTLRDINRDANAATGLRYGEVDRAQAEQGRQIPVYYQNYLDQVSGIKTGVQAGYQKAIDDVTARQQATAASDTTARNSLGSQMQADAASRGATVDPSLLANDVNAANVRNTNQSAFANLLGAQQAAQGTYFAGQQQVGAASQLDSQRRLAADVKGTAADKGLYKSQYVSEGRDAERKYGLERSAFGLDVAQEQNKVATARAQRKATSRNARAGRRAKGQEVNKYGYTNEQWARFSPSHRQRVQKQLGSDGTGPAKAKGGKGLTPAQRAARSEKWGTATSRAMDAGQQWTLNKSTKYDFGDGKPRAPKPSEIKAKLIKGGFSTEEIHIGWLIEHNKPFSAKDRAIARRLHIRVPKQRGKPKKNNRTERAIDRGDQAGPPSPVY